ncbi:MAG: hypothetical protein JWO08_4375 [Verrucomicrobiaceae bacterium]|nr:hypothetical protein [Verrucomicrobiaceae bacterium]
MEMACLHERQTGDGQLSLVICGRLGDSHQDLVLPFDLLKILEAAAAGVTSAAVRIQRELTLFVPKALFLGKEQKQPPAVLALMLLIIVVRHMHGGRGLSQKIGHNRGARDDYRSRLIRYRDTNSMALHKGAHGVIIDKGAIAELYVGGMQIRVHAR